MSVTHMLHAGKHLVFLDTISSCLCSGNIKYLPKIIPPFISGRQKMTGIGVNVEISGSGIIKWNSIGIKGMFNTFQDKLYYMPILGKTILILPQSYFRVELGGNMTVTMDII